MISKIFRALLVATTVAALVAVLVFLYAKTRSVDTEKKTQVDSYLKQWKQLDAEWNVDVLKSRAEINKNYDPLTSPLATLIDLQGKLGVTAKATKQPGADNALSQLKAALEEKIDLVDAFKSQNAILKNSLRYVPTAVEELRLQIRDARLVKGANADSLAVLDTHANQVLNDILKYNLLPDHVTAQNIEATLGQMEALDATYPIDVVQSVRNLLNHARTILRQRVAETDLLTKISAVPMTSRIDELGKVFDVDFQAALAESDRYRNYLIAYSGVLLVFLAYVGSRLFRSYRIIAGVNKDLKQANETLELRVRERTAELSQALVDLKESEAQLVQTEKMASLGQMVAGVAHEINTPLAYVRSSLETVESQLSGFVSEFMEGMISLITSMRSGDATEEQVAENFVTASALMDSYTEYGVMSEIQGLLKDGVYGVDQIKEIVVNLKNFSRLDRSREAHCTIEECLESTLQLAKTVIKTKKISKRFSQTPPISCSPSQINQVFLNLITNAAQATPDEGGVITVVTKMQGTDHVAVEVMDNGVGIPEDVLPKIFDPFFTTKEVGKGTGLGLSIVYKIVQQHGGEIKVHSKEGVGTKFTVVLPVKPIAENPQDGSPEFADAMAIAA